MPIITLLLYIRLSCQTQRLSVCENCRYLSQPRVLNTLYVIDYFGYKTFCVSRLKIFFFYPNRLIYFR